MAALYVPVMSTASHRECCSGRGLSGAARIQRIPDNECFGPGSHIQRV
jgi:hypothetical protein